MRAEQRIGFSMAATAMVADQLSKNVLLFGFGFIDLRPYERVDVLPFFDLVMVWNRGVSYGLFQAQGISGTIFLTLFSLGAAAALSWWLLQADRRFLAIGLGMVIGGALGNVIDRIRFGAVADFFHFFAFGYDWYVFNVADAAITIGVLLLLADAFLRPEAGAEPGPGTRPGAEPGDRDRPEGTSS